MSVMRSMAVLVAVGWATHAMGQATPAAKPAKAPGVKPTAKAAAPAAQYLAIAAQVPGAKGGAAHTLLCAAPVAARVPVGAVAFSPDGKLLAAGGRKEVLLWDLATGALSARIGADSITGTVQALAFVEQGKTLAVGEGAAGERGAVRLMDLTGKLAASLDQPADQVTSLAVSPDGKRLAAGSADSAAYVWTLDDRKLVGTLKGHSGPVRCVAFSRDGKQLATGSDDRTARVWQTADWALLSTLEQSEAVLGVAFNADNQYLLMAVSGDNQRATVFRHWQNMWQAFAVDVGAGRPQALWWDIPSNRAYLPCSDGSVQVVASDRWPYAVVRTLEGHGDWAVSVALSADGKRLASGGADGTVKLWNVADGAPIATMAQLAPGADRWLTVTGQGYAASSAPDALRWSARNLLTPSAKLKGLLLQPDAVAKALAGQPGPPPALEWNEAVAK